MEVNIKPQDGITVVELIGEIDGKTAPFAQQQILPLAVPGAQIIMDMTRLEYMSSAGLRMMLLLHRKFSEQGGQIVLVGLNENIRDTMSATGFLTFFALGDSYEAGLEVLRN